MILFVPRIIMIFISLFCSGVRAAAAQAQRSYIYICLMLLRIIFYLSSFGYFSLVRKRFYAFLEVGVGGDGGFGGVLFREYRTKNEHM